ncbi:hypothetical protein B0H14DRAFT_3785046 [Mycena olivaceomarginata]|nr:hypothetical protein B0H14DRAFT_3785046 [Mycena olivaceomarginata]
MREMLPFSAHRTPLAPVSQILDDEDHSGPSPARSWFPNGSLLQAGSRFIPIIASFPSDVPRLPDAYHSCIASFSDTRYHNLYSVRYPEMPLAYLEAKPSVIISCISLTLYSSFFSVGLWLSAAILFYLVSFPMLRSVARHHRAHPVLPLRHDCGYIRLYR